MAWQDQGRQEHGWFGDGKGGREGGGDTLFGPDGRDPRIDAVAYGAIGHVPKSSRTHAAVAIDNRALGRMRTVMTAWDSARSLGRDEFRSRFLDADTSDEVVDLLRNAARGAADARTHPELKAASADLAGAIQRTGLNRWPRYLADAADRAAATDMGSTRASDPAAPVPLMDDQGRQVIGRDGKTVLRPAGLDPQFFIQQGLQDRRIVEALLQNDGGSGAGSSAVLGYIIAQLLNFDRGAPWDAQRIGGRNRPEYVDYATIAIGLYAAAAGISRAQILEIQDLRARSSQYPPETEYDTIYSHLPTRNIRNTDIGYGLFHQFGIGN